MYFQQKQRSSLKFSNVLASLKTGATAMSNVAQQSDLHFPTSLMNLETEVWVFKAVIAQNQKLVNVGNSVRIQQTGMSGVSIDTVVMKFAPHKN